MIFAIAALPGFSVEDGVFNMHTYVNAPDFKGAVGWLNTDKPISLKDLRGKIVLLDFWTFCCINCMHVLPDLHRLEQKYKNELVVIGIHSAKFENEKDTHNIREAIVRYGIEHPVANDANFAIWHAYGVQAWPTLVLIGPDGKLLGQVSGEGNHDVLDAAIARAIEVYGSEGKLDRKPITFSLEKDKQKHSELSFPGKINVDAEHKLLLIADTGHNRIVVTDFNGKVQTTIGSGKQGFKDGTFAEAAFHHPQGLAMHNGALYVCDTENHALRRIDFNAKTVETIAGDGQQAVPMRSVAAVARQTRLNSPWDLTFIGEKMYIAMAGSHQIWMLDLPSGKIYSLAGGGRENIVDGPLAEAALAQPSGIATDGTNLYFADSEVSAVRECKLGADGVVQTIIGHGLFDFGDRDGGAKTALFQHPLGVAYKDGMLYVADSYNHKIKLVDPVKRTATTFAGTGKPGTADGAQSQFSEPGGLCVYDDRLFVADTNNHAIRSINLKDRSVKTLPLSK